MKKLICTQIFCLMIICGFSLTEANAVGIGFYGSSGSGSAEWEEEEDDGDTWDFDTDTKHRGFGFVLDTAVAKNKVFNYRLSIGFEKFKDELKDNGDTLKLNSFVIDQDFGFGVVITKNFRLWLGPELRISFSEGENDYDYEFRFFGLGVAPVIGMNFNVGSVVTFAVKGGYMFVGYAGTGEDENGWDDEDIDYTIREKYPFINFAIIFRINDMF